MLNRVVLIGRLTADPELRYTGSGVPVASLRLAVDRPFTSSSGERQTDFINLVAWRQSAEFAANYLGKGRLIAVDGRLQIRQWTTQDGQRRQTAEVVADRLQALDRPREGAAQPSGEPAAQPSGEPAAQPSGEPGAESPPSEDAVKEDAVKEDDSDVPGPWDDQ